VRFLLFLLLFLLPASAVAEPSLTVRVVDGKSWLPTPARLAVIGSDSSLCYPPPDSLSLFHTGMGGYFYTDSVSVVPVPAGETRLFASKGPEYGSVSLVLDVVQDTTVEILLERVVDLRSMGWVGADLGIHLNHLPIDYHVEGVEAKRVALAEGLPIANFLENGYLFTGAVDSLSDSSVTLFYSEEYRSPIFGHLDLVGIDTLVLPDCGGMGWPLNRDIVRRVRGHDHALAIYAHPFCSEDFFDVDDWPGTGLAREIWVDVALDAVDGLEVLCYSNLADERWRAFTLWYRLWNAGFPVPGTVGTDTGVGAASTRPAGALRVYTKVDDPYAAPAVLFDEWGEAHRRGRTFVTTGPLLTAFDVNGAGAGETLYVADGFPVDVTVSGHFEFARKLKTIDLVVNGEVARTFSAGNQTSADVSATIRICETSWIALRHDAYVWDPFGPTDYAICHPTPVLVLLEGDELTSSESGSHALEQLDLLDSLLSMEGTYPSPAESTAVQEAIDSARVVWGARGNGPPQAFRELEPPQGGRGVPCCPTLSWEPAADPDSGDTVTYRLVLATDHGFGTIIIDTSGIRGTSWTASDSLTVGTRYWWRVQVHDGRGARRWAEEIHRWFEVGPATDVAGAPDEEGRPLLLVRPNPSAPGETSFWIGPSGGGAEVAIFDVTGRRVRTIRLDAAGAEIRWDGRDDRGRFVGNGTYFCRVTSGDRSEVRRVTLVR